MNALGLFGFFTVKNIAEEVKQTTIEKYGINGYQDDSDAFRHIYLTCVLYDRISRSFAIDLMTAHESETAAGEKIREPHVVTSGAGRYTNCVLCGESLDTIVDDPFFVMYSLARKNSITAITTLNYPHIYLTKEEWKKYVEGAYFDGEKIV